MASTYTSGKEYLEKQATGENDSTWGTLLNAVIDNIAYVTGGVLNKSVAGSADVTLSTAEARNKFHQLTGVLGANINYIVPNGTGDYAVYNNTTGAYTVTVKTGSGTGVSVPQGTRMVLYCDGTNVVQTITSISGYLASANNLSDLASASSARTNLGLGTAATTAASGYATAAQGAKADTALQAAAIGVTVQGYDATTLKSAAIGVTVQGYDANTVKTTATQSLTNKTFDATSSFSSVTNLPNGPSIGSSKVPQWNGSAWVGVTPGTGTVTSIIAGTGLTGGTITGSGTIAVDLGVTVQAYDANTVKKNVANAFTAQQTPLKAALTDAATVAWDCSAAQVATLTTGAARTMGAPTNGVSGTSYRLVLTTGGYTPSWNTAFKFPGGTVPSSLTGTCVFDFYYDGTNFLCVGQNAAEA